MHLSMETMKKVTETIEDLILRVDNLEDRQGSYAKEISKVATTQEVLLEKMELMTKQLVNMKNSPEIGAAAKDSKALSEHKSFIRGIKHYVNVGKVTGQVIEIIANSAVLVLDTLNNNPDGSDNVAEKAGHATAGTSGNETEISGILQSVNNLVREITVTLNKSSAE